MTFVEEMRDLDDLDKIDRFARDHGMEIGIKFTRNEFTETRYCRASLDVVREEGKITCSGSGDTPAAAIRHAADNLDKMLRL